MVTTEAAQNISIPAMSRLQLQAAALVQKDPAVAGVASLVGAGVVNPTQNVGHLAITLIPRRQRDPAPVVITRLRRALSVIPGLTTYMQPVQDIQIGARVSRTQYQYTLMDTDGGGAGDVAAAADRPHAANAGTARCHQRSAERGFATDIVVDRDAATRLGVTMQSIEDVLYDAYGQRQISTIFAQSNQYRVVMEADPSWIADPASLLRLRVPGTVASIGANGAAATASTTVATTNTVAQVPLTAVAHIEKHLAPLVITHQSQFPAATISFNVREGASLGDAVTSVRTAEQDIGLPETLSGTFAGDAEEFQRSLAAEPWLILAAVAVIYIVLGVLYESFIHPVTIISTLPSAGIGALLALMLTGADLSIVALVGIVLLMGIVKKNGDSGGGFRAGGGTRAWPFAGGGRGGGVRAAVPADHDDHRGGAAGVVAAGGTARDGQRTALAAGGGDRWWAAAEPGDYALYDTVDLRGVRAVAAQPSAAVSGGGGMSTGRRKARGSAPGPSWGRRPQTPFISLGTNKMGSGAYGPSGSRAEPWPSFP